MLASHTHNDHTPAALGTGSTPSTPKVLGHESVNRQQYSLQKASASRATNRTAAGIGSVGVGVTSGGGLTGAGVGGTGSDSSGGSPLSPAQLSEVEALLRCFRQRAVYIMGRSQLVAASEGGEGEAARCKGVAAAGHYCKGVVTGAYRVLANNTHPSSQSWRLPDDQLMMVSVVVRI
jgi:hypothetical protein